MRRKLLTGFIVVFLTCSAIGAFLDDAAAFGYIQLGIVVIVVLLARWQSKRRQRAAAMYYAPPEPRRSRR